MRLGNWSMILGNCYVSSYIYNSITVVGLHISCKWHMPIVEDLYVGIEKLCTIKFYKSKGYDIIVNSIGSRVGHS